MNRSRRGDGEIVVVVVVVLFCAFTLWTNVWLLSFGFWKGGKSLCRCPLQAGLLWCPGLKDKRARDSLFGLASRGCYKLPAKQPHTLSLVWKRARERRDFIFLSFFHLIPISWQIVWTTLTSSSSERNESQWWPTDMCFHSLCIYVSWSSYLSTFMGYLN